MIPNAILAISSGGRRRASLSGTSEPSTRNMGGRPAFRWMSEAPPRRAIVKISLSSMGSGESVAPARPADEMGPRVPVHGRLLPHGARGRGEGLRRPRPYTDVVVA